MARYSLREMKLEESSLMIRYFLESDVQHLHGMGVDPEKLPSEENWLELLQEDFARPLPQRQFYYLLWQADGEPIGHCNINKIVYGESAYMHLHIWNAEQRRNGCATELLGASIRTFLERFQLEQLFCEPYAKNPAPNRALPKIGFTLVKTYETTPGWITFHQPVNLWVLDREKFLFDLIPPEYLAATEIIDHTAPDVRALAVQIKGTLTDESVIARRCFEWVRDHIEHSLDFQRTELTCRASDVLAKRTGYCYAKSHLLAALLRANGIPAGFCYQRLTLDGDHPPYCLHGLNAVYLNGHGWYRMDARGNKQGIDAQFTPPLEQLAFSTSSHGEFDFPEVWAQPLPSVVEALKGHGDVLTLAKHLPDLSLHQMNELRSQSSIPFMILNCGATK